MGVWGSVVKKEIGFFLVGGFRFCSFLVQIFGFLFRAVCLDVLYMHTFTRVNVHFITNITRLKGTFYPCYIFILGFDMFFTLRPFVRLCICFIINIIDSL